MDVPVIQISLQICRFCLRCSTEELVNVCEDVELVFKILACLSLEVAPEDGLPGTICRGCLKLVEKLALFRDQCARAELLLRASRHCALPLLNNFERVDGVEEPRAVGVDVGVQVDEPSDAGEVVEKVVLQEPTMLDDEGWQLAEEPDDEVLVDLTYDLYGEEDAGGVSEENRNVIQESTVSNSLVLDQSNERRPPSPSPSDASDSSSSLDTCSFVSNNDDLRQQMKDMILANDDDVTQPLPEDETRNWEDELDVQIYEISSSPEPDHPTESLEEPKSSGKHNWSSILNPSKPQTLDIPDTPASPDPETPASPTLDTVFGECESISDDDDDTTRELDIYDGCEPISDEDLLKPQPETSEPGEIFDCDLCDKVYPRLSLLEAHLKTFHTSLQKKTTAAAEAGAKMTIVIDNPTRKCPKCGEQVHKASFWAHKKSHCAAERQLELGYERAEVTI